MGSETELDMPSEDAVVGRKTAVGGTWTVGARLISRCIDLVTMVVLAHILRPNDFGLIAIAMTVIYIVEAALELPLSQALVRLSHTEPAHYDTAFTLGLVRGLALSAIVCLVSWPFAHFYADRRLLALVCLLSLAPASRGLVSPRLADYSRRLDFAPDFIMEFVGKIAAFAAAISIAVTTRSYWSIVAGTLAAPVVSTAVSYIIAPYRPRLSLSRLSAFSGFLGWITAAQVVSSINWQADRLLMGKLTSRTDLGLFTAANDTANIPLLAFMSPIMRPLLSAFSVVRENAARLKHSYQSSAIAIVTVGLPVLVGESLIAKPGVRLLFGEKWNGSAPLLHWLALSLIPTLFASPMGPLVMAFDKTQIFLRRNIFEISVKLPLVIVGAIKFSFMGIIFARGVSELATVIYSMLVVRKLIGLSVAKQVIGPWRSVVSACVMGLVVSSITPSLASITRTSTLAIGTILTVLAGASSYVITLFLLWFASASPPGLEAMVASKVSVLLRHGRSAPVEIA